VALNQIKSNKTLCYFCENKWIDINILGKQSRNSVSITSRS